jgi:hypothetical protein
MAELNPSLFGAGPEQVVRDLVCAPATSVYAARFGSPTDANFLIPPDIRPTPGPRQGPDDPEVRLLNTIVLDYPDDATTVAMLNRIESDPGVRTVSRNSLGTYSTPPGQGTDGGSTGPRFSWVFEFYNPARDHYFLTQSRAEFRVLDVGCLPGWRMMVPGGFNAKLPSDAPQVGYQSVCRYYGRPEAGLDSHFYSASATECAAVAQLYPDAFVLESSDAFEVFFPDVQTGACPATSTPVYRLYNNRADVNHRYVTSLGVRNAMALHGWIPEGYGPDAVAFCAPSAYAN